MRCRILKETEEERLLSNPDKTKMIEELATRLTELESQKDTHETEARGWAEQRDSLHKQIRTLREEVNALRDRRDTLNAKVKDLKQQRNERTAKIHEKIEETKNLIENRKALVKKKPSRSHEALEKEVQNIDWTIQTTSLSLQEDRELVEKVRQLEAHIAIYKKMEDLTRSITTLRADVETLRNEARLLHAELTEKAAEGQQIHRNMIAKVEQSKTLKKEADDSHKKFVEAKVKTRPLQLEIESVSNEIGQLKAEILEEEQREKKQSEEALREKLEKQARDKLKRGEKLSWEEFQLLAEKGMEAQD